MKHVVPKRAPAAPHALTQTSFRPVAAPKPQSPARKPPSKCRALVIGISTGGPAALTKVMPSIVANFPIPIFIVQHMPAGFTAYFAESLNKACALRVSEAKEGQKVSAGDIVIAPGGYHMEVRAMGGQASVHLTEDAPENACRPAVDVLFRSAAKVYGSQLLSVIMTGMGKDGLAGVGDVRKAGGYCLIQESSSCAVYGMPRAVEEAGLADEVVLIEQIAGRIQTLAGGRLRRSA